MTFTKNKILFILSIVLLLTFSNVSTYAQTITVKGHYVRSHTVKGHYVKGYYTKRGHYVRSHYVRSHTVKGHYVRSYTYVRRTRATTSKYVPLTSVNVPTIPKNKSGQVDIIKTYFPSAPKYGGTEKDPLIMEENVNTMNFNWLSLAKNNLK